MITFVSGSSSRISRQASTPDPSGSRTSMTTMSGRWRRAWSIDSATDPAWATTSKPGRRSSSATRPCRTTSWSSTTSRRKWPGGLRSRPRQLTSRLGSARWATSTMIRVPSPLALSICSVAPIASARARMLARPLVAGLPPARERIEPDAVVGHDESRARRPPGGTRRQVAGLRMPGRVAEGLADELEELGAVLGRDVPPGFDIDVDVELDQRCCTGTARPGRRSRRARRRRRTSPAAARR